MLRRNGPVVKSVESVLRLEGSLWRERFVEEVKLYVVLLCFRDKASEDRGKSRVQSNGVIYRHSSCCPVCKIDLTGPVDQRACFLTGESIELAI